MADRAARAWLAPTRRPQLPFRSVNRKGAAGYDPGVQRHHLLPCQLRRMPCFGLLLRGLGAERLGFDDFRSNGMLLPAGEAASMRLGLPLHRGPHRRYNELVVERVGQIERRWSRVRLRDGAEAACEAAMRIGLLQRALRRRLLAGARRRFILNRSDPLGAGFDFSELDAMADSLWAATQPISLPSSSTRAA